MRQRFDALDRTSVVCLAVLLVFGAIRLACAHPEDFASASGTLASSYLAFVGGSGQATFLYVPLFAFCTAASSWPALSPMWLSRGVSRMAALRRCVAAVVTRALAFALSVLIPSVAALILKSGFDLTVGRVLAFGAVQLVYEACFFVVTGLVFLAGRLVTGSEALALVLAIVYGASDTLVSALVGSHDGSLWTGWMLMGLGDPADPLLALAGLLRLAAFVALPLIVCQRALREVDFLEDGGLREVS